MRSPLPGTPLGRHTAPHRVEAALCEALEAIADALPEPVSPCLLARTRTLLDGFLDEAARQESGATSGLAGLSEGLLAEARKDAYLAEEVADALASHARGEENPAPEALGYLLRHLFDRLAHRRIIERELVWRIGSASRETH